MELIGSPEKVFVIKEKLAQELVSYLNDRTLVKGIVLEKCVLTPTVAQQVALGIGNNTYITKITIVDSDIPDSVKHILLKPFLSKKLLFES